MKGESIMSKFLENLCNLYEDIRSALKEENSSFSSVFPKLEKFRKLVLDQAYEYFIDASIRYEEYCKEVKGLEVKSFKEFIKNDSNYQKLGEVNLYYIEDIKHGVFTIEYETDYIGNIKHGRGLITRVFKENHKNMTFPLDLGFGNDRFYESLKKLFQGDMRAYILKNKEDFCECIIELLGEMKYYDISTKQNVIGDEIKYLIQLGEKEGLIYNPKKKICEYIKESGML